jgi:hypothetical protein
MGRDRVIGGKRTWSLAVALQEDVTLVSSRKGLVDVQRYGRFLCQVGVESRKMELSIR